MLNKENDCYVEAAAKYAQRAANSLLSASITANDLFKIAHSLCITLNKTRLAAEG